MEDVCVDNSSNTCIYADVCDAYGKTKKLRDNKTCCVMNDGHSRFLVTFRNN